MLQFYRPQPKKRNRPLVPTVSLEATHGTLRACVSARTVAVLRAWPPRLLAYPLVSLGGGGKWTGPLARRSENGNVGARNTCSTPETQHFSEDDHLLFVAACERSGLDPFARQIYAMHREGKLVIEATIDGLRLSAERTKQYAGQLGPEWCGPDGVWKDIWTEPQSKRETRTRTQPARSRRDGEAQPRKQQRRPHAGKERADLIARCGSQLKTSPR